MRALVALLFIVGCGDSSYNCDNDEDTIFAMKLKYDEVYNKFDPRLDKILDDYLSLIEINSRELISIDDKAKRSICTAKYRIRNPKNEKEFKIMAKFLLVATNSSLLFFTASQNGKNEFFDGIENNLKTRKDELSKMIERNSATQQTITYDAYDNGRGETFIEVQ